MNENMPNQHISSQFDDDLEALRESFLKMGGVVEQQLKNALQAFGATDEEKARQVEANDSEVDRMEVDLDKQCALVLVKRNPAAVDLRLVLSISRSVTDLERVGDEAAKIARYTMSSRELTDPRHGRDIDSLGKDALEMVHRCLDAFARQDPRSAYDVASRDQNLDKQCNRAVLALVESMTRRPQDISAHIGLLWVLRALERIGDHACNVAENVIYLVGGQDVRHQGLEQMAKEVQRD